MSFAYQLRGKLFFRHLYQIAISLLLAGVFTVFVQNYWLIDYLPPTGRWLYPLIWGIAIIAFAAHWFLSRWISLQLLKLDSTNRLALIALAILLGFFLFLAGTAQWQKENKYIYFLMPEHKVEVSALPRQSETDLTLTWFRTSLGDISFGLVEGQGWQKEDEGLSLRQTENYLSWEGKTGDTVALTFDAGTDALLQITRDGLSQTYSVKKGINTFQFEFPVPFYASHQMLCLLGWVEYAFFALAALLYLRPAWDKICEECVQIMHVPAPWQWGELATLVGGLLLALLLRLPNLANMPIGVDELRQLVAGRQILESGAAFQAVYPRSLWILTMPVAFAMQVFGQNIVVARMVGVIANALAIFPLYFLSRRFNRHIAAIAVILYATNPLIIVLSRIIREYAYYPLFFYAIFLLMLEIIEKFPDNFVIHRDLRKLFQESGCWKWLLLGLPIVYALYDRTSTFKIIGVAYILLALFLVAKMDWKSYYNLPVFIAIVLAIVAGYWWSPQKISYASRFFIFNYFFPNPPQQWYFNRLVIFPALAVAIAIFIVITIRKTSTTFLASLLGVYLLAFALLQIGVYPYPRYLLIAELLYLLLFSLGIYGLWVLVKTLLSPKIRGIFVLVVLLLSVNFSHIMFPVVDSASSIVKIDSGNTSFLDTPVTYDFLQAHYAAHDVIIATDTFAKYVEWVQFSQEQFNIVSEIPLNTSPEIVQQIVEKNRSGWVIIGVPLWADMQKLHDYLEQPLFEYYGIVGEHYIWHWHY